VFGPNQSVREGDVVQRGLINLNAQLRTEHAEKRVDVDDKNRTVRLPIYFYAI
jgi:hypothetical protein